jgi:regulator of sirC expression with transglutaminase-like and TPR domain
LRREYANALADAPWWADVWFNLAKVDEQLGNGADVRRDLAWYLRAAPDAPDRDQIRRQIETMQ